MLGLLLLYWIGKYYYQLAQKFDKSKWGFAILGVATYYGVMISVMLIFLVICLLAGIEFDFEANETLMSLAAIPFGFEGVYFLYKFLEKKWTKEYVNPLAEIDAIGVTNE